MACSPPNFVFSYFSSSQMPDIERADSDEAVRDQELGLVSMDYGDGEVRPEEDEEFEVENKPSSYYNIKKLRARHHSMIRMHVQGKKGTEIAEALGVTRQNVYQVLNSDLAQQQIAYLEGELEAEMLDFQKEVEDLLPLALATHEDIMMNGEKDSDRRQSADSLIDTSRRISKNRNVEHEHHKVDEQDLSEIKKRAAQAQDGQVEDAVFEDVEAEVEDVDG